MTDQTIPDVTDEERMLARGWAESVESNTDFWGDRVRAAARVILDAVPAPPRPTLADMTAEERAACRWMQADTESEGRTVILQPNASVGRALMLDQEANLAYAARNEVTPRPDLPRMEWPSTGTPAPAPALPDGWRLADHKDYGRVIVTTQTPDRDGYVYAVIPDAGNFRGYDWHFCDPDRLTYLDQEADQ